MIDDISITKSAVMQNSWMLHVESGGHKFTGHFGDIRGFLQAVMECGQFIMYRSGKLKRLDSSLSRQVRPN